MADGDNLNYDPSTELPPQATGGLPGAAADAADIAPAPSAAEALVQANVGDQLTPVYQRLQALNQQAPTPSANPAAAMMPPPGAAAALAGSVPGAMAGIPQPNVLSPVANALTALGGGDPNKQAAQQLQRQELNIRMAQQSQQMALADATYLEKLQNEPFDVRAMMIQNYAMKSGRPLSAAEAHYIASISPEAIQHTIALAQQGDPTALGNIKALYGGDPTQIVSAKADIMKRNAEASKAVDEATQMRAKTPYAGVNAYNDAAKKALDLAREIRGTSEPLSADKLDTLKSAGYTAWAVPIPGVAGAFRWNVGPISQAPKGVQQAQPSVRGSETSPPATAPAAGAKPSGPQVTPGVLNVDVLHESQAKAAGEKAAAREAATTTANTRGMKEKAPKVRELANQVEAAMAPLQLGPGDSRLQRFMSGKIGAPNPAFTEFMGKATLLTSLLANMHVGAKGGGEYISKKFDDLLGAGYQSPENLHAALKTIRDYADIVQNTKEGDQVGMPGAEGGGASGLPSGAVVHSFDDFVSGQ